MCELILLRHAHAEPTGIGQTDFDRPLSQQGMIEAEAAGHWLCKQHLIPDRVLCSPARHTRETLEAIVAVLGDVEQRLEERLYEATVGTLMALADECRDVDRLLLVGHNPSMERLVSLIHSNKTSDDVGMSTGSIALLTLPLKTGIELDTICLTALWWP